MKKSFEPSGIHRLMVILALLGSTGMPAAHAGGRTPDQSELGGISPDYSIGFEAKLLGATDQSFYFHVNKPGDVIGSLRFTDTPTARFQSFRLALKDAFWTPPDANGASFLIEPTHPVSADGRSVMFELKDARVGDYWIWAETKIPRDVSVTIRGTLGMPAVPEPGALGMLAAGVVGVAGWAARSRRPQ